METKPNLYQKIQSVSNKVKNIEKNMTVGTGNYQYKAVSDLDVTLAIKDAETEFGLVSIPMKQELISHEIVKTISKDGKEGITYVDNIKMTVKIVDLDDTTQFIEIESFGKGIDSGDKGFGKASTYARKYALLNAYKIATGEDPDAQKSQQQESPKTPSEKRIAVENYLNKNVATLQNMLQHFSVGQISDFNEKQIESIYKTAKEKNLL